MLTALALPPFAPLPLDVLPPAPPVALAMDWRLLIPLILMLTFALPPTAPAMGAVALKTLPPTPPLASTVAAMDPPPELLVVRLEEALPLWPGLAPSLEPPSPPMAD